MLRFYIILCFRFYRKFAIILKWGVLLALFVHAEHLKIYGKLNWQRWGHKRFLRRQNTISDTLKHKQSKYFCLNLPMCLIYLNNLLNVILLIRSHLYKNLLEWNNNKQLKIRIFKRLRYSVGFKWCRLVYVGYCHWHQFYIFFYTVECKYI